MECCDERVRDHLQFSLVTDIHLPGIRHGNGIQSTATIHTEGAPPVALLGGGRGGITCEKQNN